MRALPVVLALVPTIAAAEPRAELRVTELGWPAATIAANTRRMAYVRDVPHGKQVATLLEGTRVTWTRILAGDDRCKAWLELVPRGLLCERDVEPTSSRAAPKPSTETGIPPKWADVRPPTGTDAFDDVSAIKDKVPSRRLSDGTYVVMKPNAKVIAVNETKYIQTDQGFVANDDLAWYTPSPFAGIELAPRAAFDFAWAVTRAPGETIAVRDGASPAARQVRTLSSRTRVSVARTYAGFAQIGDHEWIDLLDLRRPTRQARPQGIAPRERWIDIDLDAQVAVLYEGDAPVFATLISSGKPKWETPTGIFRIHGKDVKSRMQGERANDAWNVADVPWAMRFRRSIAIHGAYWHDEFGRVRSRGCINLSPADARRVFEWVTPLAPDGWATVVANGDGTPLRIHSKRDPDPVWRDFEGRVSNGNGH